MPPESPKYQTKVIHFQGKTITMYSIDGFTWSTRRDELQVIKSRHEQELQNLAKVKEEATAKTADGESEEKGEAEEPEEEASGPVRIDLSGDGEDDDEEDGQEASAPKGKRGRPKVAAAKKPAPKKAVPAKSAKAKKK